MPIRLHWSFPLLLVVVLAPAENGRGALSLLGSVTWVVALFACIVVHELSHSFVARRRGFVVRDIVLLPIGGASEIVGLPGAPADELSIALAGPLASLGLGILFTVFAYLTGAHPWPPSLLAGAVPVRLMWANFLLAGFNLLPAIPMDGGRVLRAVLARSRSDLSATVLAVRVGRLMGLAMVLVGIRYDIWLCLIGLFVVVGGSGEVRAAAVRTATGGLKVQDVMVHDPTTLEVSFPLSVVAPFLEATPGRILPVLDAGQYVGLIAADHLPGSEGALRVADAMDRLAPPLASRDPLYPVAVESLLGAHRRAAAVIENGQVVGVIYAAHLEAALRRAASSFGASSASR